MSYKDLGNLYFLTLDLLTFIYLWGIHRHPSYLKRSLAFIYAFGYPWIEFYLIPDDWGTMYFIFGLNGLVAVTLFWRGYYRLLYGFYMSALLSFGTVFFMAMVVNYYFNHFSYGSLPFFIFDATGSTLVQVTLIIVVEKLHLREKLLSQGSYKLALVVLWFLYLSVIYLQQLALEIAPEVYDKYLGFGILAAVIEIIILILLVIRASLYASKKAEYYALKSYTEKLEAKQKSMAELEHDYRNLLLSVQSRHDINILDQYAKRVVKTPNLMTGIRDLENITNANLSKFLGNKFTELEIAGVKVRFECPYPLPELHVDTLDLVRMLGILCDNAKEASLQTDHPQVDILFYTEDNLVEITISNPYIPQGVSLDKLRNRGVTTKDNHKGLGLVNLEKISKAYSNVLINFNQNNNNFVVQIIIEN